MAGVCDSKEVVERKQVSGRVEEATEDMSQVGVTTFSLFRDFLGKYISWMFFQSVISILFRLPNMYYITILAFYTLNTTFLICFSSL